MGFLRTDTYMYEGQRFFIFFAMLGFDVQSMLLDYFDRLYEHKKDKQNKDRFKQMILFRRYIFRQP